MRLSNKGFAITTIIYGLSIMGILLVAILMGTLATTRTNNRNLSKSILEELSRFSKTEIVFENSTELQQFTVPTDEGGWYRIELWGAQGNGGAGGLGAYTSGIVELKSNDILYFYVGNTRSGAGGEETDVRIVSGEYSEAISFETRIMVAAEGGKDPGSSGGTLVGYQNSMNGIGGYIDVKSEASTFAILNGVNNTKTTDTLIGLPVGYTKTNIDITSIPALSILGSNGGGDGYIPSNLSSVGGTSFISGYGGSRAVVKGSRTNDTLYTFYQSTYQGSTGTYVYSEDGRAYYFVDGMMLPGVNRGNGMARIERLYEHEVNEKGEIINSLPRKNNKFDNVRYIRDCIHNLNSPENIVWSGVDVVKNGKRLGVNFASGEESKGNYRCKRVDLGSSMPIDEVAVWHKDGVDYINHTIEVSPDNVNWQYIKGEAFDDAGNPMKGETETVSGIHITAYQFDNTVDLPNTGNYYLLPVLSENKVISAKANGEDDGDPLEIEYINGEKRQKWKIEWIDNGAISPNPSVNREYKILELTRFKSMTVLMDENLATNRIVANSTFNNYARNEPQIWKVTPAGNGTYLITTVVPSFESTSLSGNIVPQTNIDSLDFYDNVIIGKRNRVTERYKIIAVDYT